MSVDFVPSCLVFYRRHRNTQWHIARVRTHTIYRATLDTEVSRRHATVSGSGSASDAFGGNSHISPCPLYRGTTPYTFPYPLSQHLLTQVTRKSTSLFGLSADPSNSPLSLSAGGSNSTLHLPTRRSNTPSPRNNSTSNWWNSRSSTSQSKSPSNRSRSPKNPLRRSHSTLKRTRSQTIFDAKQYKSQEDAIANVVLWFALITHVGKKRMGVNKDEMRCVIQPNVSTHAPACVWWFWLFTRHSRDYVYTYLTVCAYLATYTPVNVAPMHCRASSARTGTRCR